LGDVFLFFGRCFLDFKKLRKFLDLFIYYILDNMSRLNRVERSTDGSLLGDDEMVARAIEGASAFNNYFARRTGSNIKMELVGDEGNYAFATNRISPRGLSKIVGVVEMMSLTPDEVDEDDAKLVEALPLLKDLLAVYNEITQSKFVGQMKGMNELLKSFYRAGDSSKKYGETENFTIGQGSPVANYTRHMIALLTAILCKKKDYAEKKIAEIRPLFDELLAEGETQGKGRICKDEGDYIKYCAMVKGMYEGNEEFMEDAEMCNWWDSEVDVAKVKAMEEVSRESEESAVYTQGATSIYTE